MSPTRAFKNKSKWSNSSGKCQKEKEMLKVLEIYFLDKKKKIKNNFNNSERNTE